MRVEREEGPTSADAAALESKSRPVRRWLVVAIVAVLLVAGGTWLGVTLRRSVQPAAHPVHEQPARIEPVPLPHPVPLIVPSAGVPVDL